MLLSLGEYDDVKVIEFISSFIPAMETGWLFIR